MAAGKLLIAAVDEGSDTWKFVQETGCGLLVEPENPEQMAQAILTLYQDRRAGEEMGRRGRMQVEERFTPQVAARRYEALLQSVVERAR